MDSFVTWLNRFSEFVSLPAAWGIFGAGAVVYLINSWRLRFLALLVQYAFIGVLFTQIFDTRPELTLMKVLVGWVISGALLISAGIRVLWNFAPAHLKVPEGIKVRNELMSIGLAQLFYHVNRTRNGN